ncbi:prolyl oligopeptidase [Calocera viscosa TUFC12733]|uniref:Prolyl endopeptidase n=1 Tax=Calocera viscosa (strain TUFC12733) TaxID=1330018 RepID=A0A167KQF5_CALVF|nr:prolyl oligopeptidase [Calocera viscosa TUFC12733]
MVPPTPFDPTSTPYPPARRSEHVDVYKSELKGSVRVPDPYDWLEENEKETEEWVERQVEFTGTFIDQGPREKLYKAIKENFNYPRFSAASKKKDGYYYWYYNSGLQAQSVLYRAKELPRGEALTAAGGEVFFDPNALSKDGTAAISVAKFSKSARLWAYGVSLSGSDFFTVYVRDTRVPWTGSVDDAGKLEDEVRFCKFSDVTWTHDEKGFFYQRFPTRPEHGAANEDKAGTETTMDTNAQLFYHRIGTPQSEDILVHQDRDNEHYMWGTSVSELDGRYLLLSTSKDTGPTNRLWIADLKEQEIGPNIRWTKLVDDFEAQYSYLANDDTFFYFYTNLNAPRYRVITVDISASSPEWNEWLAEDAQGGKLEDATALPGGLWGVQFSRDVRDEVYLYDAAGTPVQRLAEEFIGTIESSGRRDSDEFWLFMVGFTTPGAAGRWVLPAASPSAHANGTATGTNGHASYGKWEPWRSTAVKGLSADEFDAEQVWYESKDGTRIPMFVVRHKSTPRDGTAPALQYGYGGFSISIKPSFATSILTFIKHFGAVYAVANIRGGGEYGEAWHEAGTRERKINVFDDFIAATEYLVSSGIAGKQKVIINGGSNGGLLVGACVNRAPENTFGAAIADVGVMDMLKFPLFTIGKAWEADFGAPGDAHDFDFIYPYSPLHNVDADKVYPPMLLLTADHDDRVVPLHSYKLAAELQHVKADNPHPLLIRVDTKSGHGAGKSTEKRIQEAADKWGFAAQTLGLEWRE